MKFKITFADLELDSEQICGAVLRYSEENPDTSNLERIGFHLCRSWDTEQAKEFVNRIIKWGKMDRIKRKIKAEELVGKLEKQLADLQSSQPNLAIIVQNLDGAKGVGISMASKCLRFLRPDICPVLDSTLCEKTGYALNPKGYERFANECYQVATRLSELEVTNPLYSQLGFQRLEFQWYAADIEIALFQLNRERAS